MFLGFFKKLRDSKIPVSLNEFLTFIHLLEFDLVNYDINKFYYLARTCLIKDEKNFDKFDIVFAEYFKSIEKIELDDVLKFLKIPSTWLEKLLDKYFSENEKNQIKSLGGFEELIKTLRKRIEEQRKRHQGGNKWIGTGGTSPFGAYGYNPEGIRIGQSLSINRRAIKVWDKRIFRDFDHTNQLDSRGFQVALKRLRSWARTGINEELDIDETIRDTAKNAFLNIKTRKEKENSIKIILFLDVGGSMDDHIKELEKLFSAAKNVFKNLIYFYFHNCLYEFVWKDNSRRWDERISTREIFRKYGREFKCIFVGDASMSPYEIVSPGGGNEHFNEEPGNIWLERAINHWSSCLWINPIKKDHWDNTYSIEMIRKIFNYRMVPLSIKGIEEGTEILSKKSS